MKTKHIIIICILSVLFSTVEAKAQNKMLIIAPDVFIDELQPLADFKNWSVRPSFLLSLSAIYNNTLYDGSRDNPEKIKKCIADFQNNYQVDTVMLVGDCDKFPVRYCCAYNTEWGRKHYPSDLYYADLYDDLGAFDNWDGDGDNIIGEMDFAGGTDMNLVNLDDINMYPDIRIARVPASTEAEVTIYVNKVIGYELNAPGNWYDDAYLVVGDWGGDSKMDGIVTYLDDFTTYKRYMSQSPWDSMTDQQRYNVFNNCLNLGTGLMLYHGHGNIHALAHWYDQDSMSGQINSNYNLPVIFATSCFTARFHFDRNYYQDVNGVTWDKRDLPGPFNRPEPMDVQPAMFDAFYSDAMVEPFLVKTNTGAIGYIGCTSVAEHGAWLDATHGLCPYFCREYDQGTRVLGELWHTAMTDFVADVEQVGMGGYYSYIHIHKMMLFGDPTLYMGGAYATKLSGTLNDYWLGYWYPCFYSNSRHDINGDIFVSPENPLSADPGASLYFSSSYKIATTTDNPVNGFLANGSTNAPVYLMAPYTEPYADHKIRGVKIKGQLRIKNGGVIKLY
ncbi:MAG: hypothetical protein GY869_32010 [Planctomycetes bacterium]|nr:hypothetical protein [Planctomycetota bacterium]